MAIGTDHWGRTFAREELLTMTIQTCGVLGKITNVRESCVAFAQFLPVLRGKLVARIARQFLIFNVCRVREL